MSNDVENLKDGGPPKSSDSATGSSNSGETQVSLYSGLLQQASVYGIAAGYCLLASLLSIINKWAVLKFPYPGALTALQYFTSAARVLLCGRLKVIKHDPLELLKYMASCPLQQF
ncbi:golgi nucleotide sugar transporter 3 [Actinidia rufa]|uniref:Golgi nucleotide sugar transporter 3 n=1 Tax=Actinidia rufa TaxID=165716 RepID=A0A7J0E6D1_9ERIC|nr:golgi nucleotide sugar transporter 3 [Actinidia rufa]